MIKDYIKKSENTWDTIAKSFDTTRQKPWDECINFIKELPKNSIVIDIGCGNGRHLMPCTKKCKKCIGLDVSKELLKIVKNKINQKMIKNVDLIHSDAINIPLKKNSVDAVLFIATLHNISNRNNRIKSLKELNRILKPEGKAIISVWSRCQDKFRQYFKKESTKKSEKKEFGDIDIYWRKNGLDTIRFYHLYSKKEFIEDIKKAELKLLDIKDFKFCSKKYPDNFFAYVKKEHNILNIIS